MMRHLSRNGKQDIITFILLISNYGLACREAYAQLSGAITPIPFTGKEIVRDGEIISSGTISSKDVKDIDRELSDGIYLFLVIIPDGKSEFLVWSPEIPDISILKWESS